jgi:MFS family permease
MESVGITNPTLGALEVSIYLFAFSVSPLILAPLSEVYGRKVILIGGNVAFIAFSIGAGFSTNV